MREQRSHRRRDFRVGLDVRLSDGETWTLPIPESPLGDRELHALLKGIAQAEDRAEVLRLELAIAILLLNRNYELSPDRIADLLSFPPGDPALRELQADVHDYVVRAIEWTLRPMDEATSTAPGIGRGRIDD